MFSYHSSLWPNNHYYTIDLDISCFEKSEKPSDQDPHCLGEDPGFLERGFLCIKVLGVRFADFISFFLKIP